MPKGFKAPVTTLSKEAKEYKAAVRIICHDAGIESPIMGRVSIGIKLYPNRPQDWQKRIRINPQGWDDTVQCLDLDNANKVLLDAIKGVVIDDDKWVRRIESERMEPDGEARLVVTIRPIIQYLPQADLLKP